MKKTNKEYLIQLQEISDKHDLLKKEIEALLQEGQLIEDKLKNSERVFAITEAINSIMLEIDDVENKYNLILDEYKKNK